MLHVIYTTLYCNICPGYEIKLDPAVLPLLPSFGGLVVGRASGGSGRKIFFYKT